MSRRCPVSERARADDEASCGGGEREADSQRRKEADDAETAPPIALTTALAASTRFRPGTAR